MLRNKFFLVPIMLLILLAIGFASASEDISLEEGSACQGIDDTSLIEEIESSEPQVDDNTPSNETAVNNGTSTITGDMQSRTDTRIESKNINTYYKENCEWTSYLKDSHNHPLSNKKVSISINGRTYNKLTDKSGKIVLKLNLKPGTYTAAIRFAGDENYGESVANAKIKVKKKSLLKITRHIMNQDFTSKQSLSIRSPEIPL